MFHKYGNEKAFEVSKDEELDARVEFGRQRQFLEQSNISLKKRVNACSKKNDCCSKIMEENMVLIEEINKLRQEHKINRKKYEDLKSIFKMQKYKNNVSSKQIMNKKSGAIENTAAE